MDNQQLADSAKSTQITKKIIKKKKNKILRLLQYRK